MKGLTPGRIVHFVEGDLTINAAIVTKVVETEEAEGLVNLTVFDSGGSSRPQSAIPYFNYVKGKALQPNSWHWLSKP